MLTFLPVFENNADLIFYLLITLLLPEISLNRELQIGFSYVFPFRRSAVKNKWYGFFSQGLIGIEFIFKLQAAHPGKIYVTYNDIGLFRVTGQKMVGIRWVGEVNHLIRNIEIL